MRIFLVVIVLCLHSVPSSIAQEQVRREVDILTLRFLLSRHLFSELDDRMQGYQQSFVQSTAMGDDIYRAVRAFEVQDDVLGGQLDRWTGMFERSAVAFASRGAYRLHVGREYARSGHDSAADSYLQQASMDLSRSLELDPLLLEANVLTIEMLMFLGDQQKAGGVLDEVLEVAPAAFQVRRSYIWGLSPHTNPGADQEMRQIIGEAGQYAGINPRLRVLEGFPDMFRGLALQSQGKHEQAVAAFSLSLEAGSFHEFYLFRAMSREALGDHAKALEDFDAALMEYRQSIDAVLGKARALRQLGRSAEADRYDAYAQDLMSFVTPVRGGTVASAEPPDLEDESVPAPEDTAATDDADVQTESGTEQPAVTAEASGADIPGIDALSARIDEDPQDPALTFERGMAFLNAREYANAEEDFRKTLELDPNDARAHYNLGWIYLHNGMYEQGIAKNSDALTLNPGFGQAYLNRAFGLRMLGRMEEAGRDLRQACALGVAKACDLLQQ